MISVGGWLLPAEATDWVAVENNEPPATMMRPVTPTRSAWSVIAAAMAVRVCARAAWKGAGPAGAKRHQFT